MNGHIFSAQAWDAASAIRQCTHEDASRRQAERDIEFAGRTYGERLRQSQLTLCRSSFEGGPDILLPFRR
jgi:hypothetical protein